MKIIIIQKKIEELQREINDLKLIEEYAINNPEQLENIDSEDGFLVRKSSVKVYGIDTNALVSTEKVVGIENLTNDLI